MPGLQSFPTGTVFAIGPDVPCPYGIRSWPVLYEPQGLQTTELPPTPQLEYGGDKGHPDGV